MLRQLSITYDEYSSVPIVNNLDKNSQEILVVKDMKLEEDS